MAARVLRRGGNGEYVGLDVSATSTGIVVLSGNPAASVLLAETVTVPGRGIERAAGVADVVFDLVDRRGAKAAVEGYAHGGPGLAVLVEVGALVRDRLRAAGVPWDDVAPSRLKKFVLGSGKGDKGQVRLAAFKRWGFEHDSDDVVDAYVLARIARALDGLDSGSLGKAQAEVVESIRGGPKTKRRRRAG